MKKDLIDQMVDNFISQTPHPLSKSQCKTCKEWVCEKDRAEHEAAHMREIPHQPAPNDEEIQRMHDLWDSERVESESREYQNAH